MSYHRLTSISYPFTQETPEQPVQKDSTFSDIYKMAESESNTSTGSPTESLEKKNICYEEKYKTALCKNWNLGSCTYGEKCVFAHGDLELRKSLGSYKSVPCKNFSAGYCVYGQNCHFQHVTSNKKLPVFLHLLSKGLRQS